jgi:redox-sensitive bicupin YhaK (pirin superfamily)
MLIQHSPVIRAKTITRVIRVARRTVNEGLSIAQLHGVHLPEHLDPFLVFDHFHMSQPYFPPRPHAGLCAVTYLFADSQGGFIHRDSLGERGEITPGELHWTTTGRGVVHEEVPKSCGTLCQGLQIFVNLAAPDKLTEPRSQHLAAKDIPLFHQDGTQVRVLVGSWNGLTSPLLPPTHVTLLDVTLEPGALFEAEVPDEESRFAYILHGEGDFGPADDSIPIHELQAGGFSAKGHLLQVRATALPLRVVIAGGRPLREPIVFQGSFCMNTLDQFERTLLDYEEGRMGYLEPSF